MGRKHADRWLKAEPVELARALFVDEVEDGVEQALRARGRDGTDVLRAVVLGGVKAGPDTRAALAAVRAAYLLGALQDHGAATLLADVMAALPDDHDLIDAASHALELLKPEGVRPLLAVLTRDDLGAHAHAAALYALGAQGDDSDLVLDTLTGFLDTHPRTAADGLATLASPAAVPALRRALALQPDAEGLIDPWILVRLSVALEACGGTLGSRDVVRRDAALYRLGLQRA